MVPDFLDSDLPIERQGDKLPHWQQDEVMQFVTFRLGDALPKAKVEHWKRQREAWLSIHPKPWSAETEREFHRRFTSHIEALLDSGAGSCLFREAELRGRLAEVLMRFQAEKVIHQAWVIMRNHVHLLFSPLTQLSKLIEAWKSVSAKVIGRGPIWQRNYRDTLIRDADHFRNAVRYIRRNPMKAGLPENAYTLWQSDRAAAVP